MVLQELLPSRDQFTEPRFGETAAYICTLAAEVGSSGDPSVYRTVSFHLPVCNRFTPVKLLQQGASI